MRPSIEQAGSQTLRLQRISGADEAGLFAPGPQFADLFDSRGVLATADAPASFGERHFDRLTIGQDNGLFMELPLGPLPGGLFVIGDAGDAVIIPRLFEKAGTVALAVEE